MSRHVSACDPDGNDGVSGLDGLNGRGDAGAVVDGPRCKP